MLFDYIRRRVRAPESQRPSDFAVTLLKQMDTALQQQPEFVRLVGLEPSLGPDFWSQLGEKAGQCSVVQGPFVDIPSDTAVHRFDVPWDDKMFCRLMLSVTACGSVVHRFVALSDFAISMLGLQPRDRRFNLPALRGRYTAETAADETYQQLLEFCRGQPTLHRSAPRAELSLPSTKAHTPELSVAPAKVIQSSPAPALRDTEPAVSEGDLGVPKRTIRGKVVSLGHEVVPATQGREAYRSYTMYVQTESGLVHERGIALKEQVIAQGITVGDTIVCDFYGGGGKSESRKIYRLRRL